MDMADWRNESVKNKIALCIQRREHLERSELQYSFPVVDILCELCRNAELAEDFYSLEALEGHIQRYSKRVEKLETSVQELQKDGWILTMFGRWDMALQNLYTWKDCVVSEEEYPDAKLLRFFIWLGKESRKHCALRVKEPEQILGRWRALYPATPGMDWFEEKHFLIKQEENYYLYRAYSYSEEIDRMLAKLWQEWGKTESSRWLATARALHGNASLAKYLRPEEQRELTEFLMKALLLNFQVPDIESMNRYYRWLRLMDSCSYMKEPEKYKDVRLWSGNRVFDQDRYDRYGFEYYRHDTVFQRECHLILPLLLKNLYWLGVEKEQCIHQLREYDRLCALYPYNSGDSSVIYELLTNSKTFYMGFRMLVCCRRETWLEREDFDRYVLEIIGQIFRQESKCTVFFKGEELGGCLLQLKIMEDWHREDTDALLEKMIDLFGQDAYMEQVWQGLRDYFAEILQEQNSVSWTKCYHLLLLCVSRWLFREKEPQQKPWFKPFIELVWSGYRRIFEEDNDSIKFLKEAYFTPEICSCLYQQYICNAAIAKRRSLLLPKEYTVSREGETRPHYYYRFLLHVLYSMYEGGERQDLQLWEIILELLERVLVAETGEHPLFEYSYIQIYSAESVLSKCLAGLSAERECDRLLLKVLEKAEVPELLIFYEAVQDEEFKNRLLAQINERAEENSLNVFHDERAMDIVLDRQLQSLYPAVEYELNRKLKAWAERNVPEAEDFVKAARFRLWRLRYERKQYAEIMAGENDFFRAIVCTEVEEYKSFSTADGIWKQYIKQRRREYCSPAVYLNYLYLLQLRLEEPLQESDRQYAEGQFEWVQEIIDEEEIAGWSDSNKEAYLWYLVQKKKRKNEDYLPEFYAFREKFQLCITTELLLEQEKTEQKLQEKQCAVGEQSSTMIQVLQAFHAMELERKSRIYYNAAGIEEINEKRAQKILLVDNILTVCDALLNYGSQLLVKGATEEDWRLYEDHVTILFREIFNHAFGRSFGMTAHDQQKMAATGAPFGGTLSPAELDLVLYYEGAAHELVEAFVLNEEKGEAVFLDHMKKVLGNNIRREELAFMIVYGNARDSEAAWKKYLTYLKENAIKQLQDKGVQQLKLLPVEDAPYYLEKFKENYTGIKLQRQEVLYDSGRRSEVLHIYVDLARAEERNIRKKSAE